MLIFGLKAVSRLCLPRATPAFALPSAVDETPLVALEVEELVEMLPVQRQAVVDVQEVRRVSVVPTSNVPNESCRNHVVGTADTSVHLGPTPRCARAQVATSTHSCLS